MNHSDEYRKKAIESLLKESQSSADAQLLQRALDEQQAQDIVNALYIERELDAIGVEKAPRSLHKKLYGIPNRHGGRPALWWVGLAAAAAVLFVSITSGPKNPSAEDIEQARQELIIAFQYLSRASDKSRSQVEATINGNMRMAVARGVLRNVPNETEEL